MARLRRAIAAIGIDGHCEHEHYKQNNDHDSASASSHHDAAEVVTTFEATLTEAVLAAHEQQEQLFPEFPPAAAHEQLFPPWGVWQRGADWEWLPQGRGTSSSSTADSSAGPPMPVPERRSPPPTPPMCRLLMASTADARRI